MVRKEKEKGNNNVENGTYKSRRSEGSGAKAMGSLGRRFKYSASKSQMISNVAFCIISASPSAKKNAE